MEPTASINLFSPSHTHILTHHPSLSSGPISLSPLLLSNGPANFLVHFTEMWQIPCDTKGVRAPQSWSLARSARERVDQPLRSWTPLNIHERLFKPACERLVSANSRATKRNFCSELKHLPISQLWRTHNNPEIKHLWASIVIISTKSSHSGSASFEFRTSSGYKISVS